MAWTKVHCNLSPNQHLESRGWFRKSFLRRANFSLYDPMMSTCPNEWILDQYILFILYLNSNINKIYIFIVDKDEDFSWLKITRKTWSPGKLNQRETGLRSNILLAMPMYFLASYKLGRAYQGFSYDCTILKFSIHHAHGIWPVIIQRITV